jgi:hypothetical protein
MSFPALSSTQVEWIVSAVAAHIAHQHQKYAPAAMPLSSEQKRRFHAFFPARVLDETRVTQLKPGRFVENPSFYEELKHWGFPARTLPDFHNMAAVTFVDVVVSHGAMSQQTLFHELVHAVQFRKIGVEGFAGCYVSGFLSGGGYDGIPLERNAYELDTRFAGAPARSFDVAAEVQSWIDTRRF